jgi:hypothetical protein
MFLVTLWITETRLSLERLIVLSFSFSSVAALSTTGFYTIKLARAALAWPKLSRKFLGLDIGRSGWSPAGRAFSFLPPKWSLMMYWLISSD